MTTDNKDLFPSENEKPYSGDLSTAIVKHIEDDIDDASVLRDWRKAIAGAMVGVSVVFYIALIIFVGCLCFCNSVAQRVLAAPTVAIAAIVVLAAVPSLILASVARAVFGKHNGMESPYSPLQAIIHLMKEMKS